MCLGWSSQVTSGQLGHACIPKPGTASHLPRRRKRLERPDSQSDQSPRFAVVLVCVRLPVRFVPSHPAPYSQHSICRTGQSSNQSLTHSPPAPSKTFGQDNWWSSDAVDHCPAALNRPAPTAGCYSPYLCLFWSNVRAIGIASRGIASHRLAPSPSVCIFAGQPVCRSTYPIHFLLLLLPLPLPLQPLFLPLSYNWSHTNQFCLQSASFL